VEYEIAVVEGDVLLEVGNRLVYVAPPCVRLERRIYSSAGCGRNTWHGSIRQFLSAPAVPLVVLKDDLQDGDRHVDFLALRYMEYSSWRSRAALSSLMFFATFFCTCRKKSISSEQ
jgi:hypothetical protein